MATPALVQAALLAAEVSSKKALLSGRELLWEWVLLCDTTKQSTPDLWVEINHDKPNPHHC